MNSQGSIFLSCSQRGCIACPCSMPWRAGPQLGQFLNGLWRHCDRFNLCHSSCWGHSVHTGVLSGTPTSTSQWTEAFSPSGRATKSLSRQTQPCLRQCSQGEEKLHASPSARKLLASSRTGTSVQEEGQAERGRPGTQEPPASKLHAPSQDQKCERMWLG